MSTSEVQNPVILFDGVCNLCNRSVQFIINRDPSGIFRFAPLQSETGKNLLSKFDLPNDKFDSIILVENNEYYLRSTAALKILQRLGALWKIVYVFMLVPRPVRDYIYDIVARNRYKWYGKRAECMIPSSDIESRFLE
ncbi:MAG: thiol-disulfide oxidoreductase DCC family protein [Candidatus Dadabacteria bacterium]|jgi:predicted DCC family thiol-disulfide oxidoreductase YuxK|nr:thiol-disulfide oxidoreductase DCC family protein [Candidatus Dadabacteria bacterium]MCZ6528510.1 thiol-disulfide oxidoreductase DCC family protein [Candidatus Dadabacteria bacterium]MCZ6639273.1 thiol-disulfide oxidoreductase DCC family protein [Candidatus Dadabacteria bacterium]MCZ6685624.1 thiol-disulfide oxidoreductase DCC family protein [Candidatus Dadabacteria bacterium]MCZ6864005.1 thiol-disulfide oxidoreductase DCC family protein [Candidatus Dadabacteria bacterium]